MYIFVFQFLQKIYKEDLDEIALEADEDLKNERKAAKETVGVKAHFFSTQGIFVSPATLQ